VVGIIRVTLAYDAQSFKEGAVVVVEGEKEEEEEEEEEIDWPRGAFNRVPITGGGGCTVTGCVIRKA
jgi:hypothetical protein